MSTTTAGITFNETLTGGFAIGEIDPKKGAERGEREGTHLRVRASVSIPDLQRFIDDPNHTGAVTGSIDLPSLGHDLQAKEGIFNLFLPTADPKLKLMVYELGFEHQGKSYYLAGRKEVRQDPGFDLWGDTTTLYTLLHEGRGTTGKILGAGIISLGLDDLLAMLASMRVTGTDSVPEQAKALMDFGRFFLGDLWESYGRPIIDKLIP